MRAILDMHWLLEVEAEEKAILDDIEENKRKRVRLPHSSGNEGERVAPASSHARDEEAASITTSRQDPTDEEMRSADLESIQLDLIQRMLSLSMGSLEKAHKSEKEGD
jgi:hypothetical protein